MALSVDKVFRFTQFVANKESRGWIDPAEFNIAAELAQIAVYSRLENAFLANKRIHSDMRPFLKTASSAMAVPSTPPHAFPADFRQLLGAIDVNGEEIVEWTQPEYVSNKNSTIVAPATAYPKCVVRDDGIYVYPVSVVTAITLEYIAKLSTAPQWNYTLVGTRPVYSAAGGVLVPTGSVDFEFEDNMFLEIATNVLMNVGMNIKDENVTQYGMAFNQSK
jgi:hypothetical protein